MDRWSFYDEIMENSKGLLFSMLEKREISIREKFSVRQEKLS
jgi:hypothetical protein